MTGRASGTRAGKTDAQLNGTAELLADFNAEESTLGAIFLGGPVIEHIAADGLLAEHFYKEPHRQVYAAMLALHQEGLPVDVLTVTDRLRRSGRLEEAGGEVGIAALTGPVPVAGNVRAYAGIVRRLANKRAIKQCALRVAAEPGDSEARSALQAALADAPATNGSTWAPIGLGTVLDGESAPPPTMLPRSDGHCLVYPGKVHAFFGEPEACKGWLALQATSEQLTAGEHVLYIDFEDGPETLVERLIALGHDPDTIREGVHYVRPDEPLHDAGRDQVDRLLTEHEPSLAVIDGVTEAMTLEGFNLADNSEVAHWQRLLPRRIAAAGTAVALIDHLVKDTEARGRFPIGGQHKLAGIDVGYSLKVKEPFGRGRTGRVTITVTKDRHGHIRQHAAVNRVADLTLKSGPDNNVTLELHAPENTGDPNTPFRPTVLMERISRAIEQTPGLSKRSLRETVHGNNNAKDLALDLLIADQYVRTEPDGQTHRHHSERPYREAQDPHRAPVPTPCPNRGPSTVESHRAPVPPPIGARGTGHGPDSTPQTDNRAPNGRDG